MRRQLITLGMAVVLALSGVAALGAQRGPGRPGPGNSGGPAVDGRQAPANGPENDGPNARGPRAGRRGGPGGRFLPGVTLTDEQKRKVQAIVRSSRDQSAPIVDQLALARKTLHRQSFADKRDNGKIASLAGNVATLEKQLLDARVKTNAAIADVLTPEQREVIRANGGFGGRGFGAGGRFGGPMRQARRGNR